MSVSVIILLKATPVYTAPGIRLLSQNEPVPMRLFSLTPLPSILFLLFLLFFLTGEWTSSVPNAEVDGDENHTLSRSHIIHPHASISHDPGVFFDEYTMRSLLYTVDLTCRYYAKTHSFYRFESNDVNYRLFGMLLENALQILFPCCKAKIIRNEQQIPRDTVPYVVKKTKEHGLGFSSNVGFPNVWIQLSSSQKALGNIYSLLAQVGRYSPSHLKDASRSSAEHQLFNLQHITFNFSDSSLDIDSPKLFKQIIQHTAKVSGSVADSKLYSESVYDKLSKLFLKVELCRYTFSSNVSCIAKTPEFTIYRRQFPLMLYTNESRVSVKGCIALPLQLAHPTKMGMIVSSSTHAVFVIYFKAINVDRLQRLFSLSHHLECSLRGVDLRKDRFLDLFAETVVS